MLKNTLFFTAALSFLAIGCSGDKDGVDSASDTGSVGDDDDDTTPVAPDVLDDASLPGAVSCNGTTVTFAVEFLGEASEGYFDAADTDNWDTTYGNWNDTHTLDASGITADGMLTDLDVTINTGATIAAWSDGVSTIFKCDYHYESAGTMTYAARAYDLNGGLADCAAWGDDAQGFIDDSNPDGDAYTINARPSEGDFASCRVVAAAK